MIISVASAHAQSAEHIYWGAYGYRTISRANLDGTNAQVLITNTTNIKGIALDLTNNHIYWSERNQLKIRRANLDGTNAQDLITGVSGGEGIALDGIAPEIASSSSSGSQVVRYVPFKSQYVVLALFSLLGCWYVLHPH